MKSEFVDLWIKYTPVYTLTQGDICQAAPARQKMSPIGEEAEIRRGSGPGLIPLRPEPAAATQSVQR
jgi:hypothetical protein